MISLINKIYLAPGISTTASSYTRSCEICNTCNLGGLMPTPKKHLAKPLYPFQQIQIDHIELPKSEKHKNVLLVVDMCPGWPEAYPVTNTTARTTVKKLLTELVCRFGIPKVNEPGTFQSLEILLKSCPLPMTLLNRYCPVPREEAFPCVLCIESFCLRPLTTNLCRLS